MCNCGNRRQQFQQQVVARHYDQPAENAVEKKYRMSPLNTSVKQRLPLPAALPGNVIISVILIRY